MADRGYGYRRSVALALRQQADVVLRIHPKDLPLGNGHGAAVHGSALAPATGRDGRDWHAGVAGKASAIGYGLIAAQLDPATAQQARRRKRRKAQKAGRTLTGPTLAVAGWLLVITNLSAATWSPTDVLYLYRARWQVELVFKNGSNCCVSGPDPEQAPHECGSHGAGPADCLGVA